MRIPLKAAGVVLGATVLSTLGISASDTLQGVSGSLVGLALQGEVDTSRCPANMTLVSVRGQALCVDMFEASAGDACTHESPRNLTESEENITGASCQAVSEPDAEPWRFISLTQAQQACAKAGKRLLTNEEWHRSALGTPTGGGECHLSSDSSQASRKTFQSDNACVSSSGVYDMVGNVWEWVDESVTEGSYNGRELPEEGYVHAVDADGVALETSAEGGQELYGNDYYWVNLSGVRGMIRGGFYGSGEDGGLYTLNASIDLSFASPGIGFRCATEARF